MERLQRQPTQLIVTFTYHLRTRLPTFTSFVDLLSNRKSLIVTRSKASMNGLVHRRIYCKRKCF